MNAETVGRTLKRQREARAMSVAEVARVTRIPVGIVESIEKDQFDDLPGEVFVRGFLRSYAQAVRLPAQEILAKYTASRRGMFLSPLPVAASVQPTQPVQGHRFGIAIAFVLLLILFTLAISIVLKPRGRDIPPELSSAAVSIRAFPG